VRCVAKYTSSRSIHDNVITNTITQNTTNTYLNEPRQTQSVSEAQAMTSWLPYIAAAAAVVTLDDCSYSALVDVTAAVLVSVLD